MIREIPEDELHFLKPNGNDHSFIPDVTSSLANALRYFWMACAARRSRGQENIFSTMLIHTSQLIAVHNSTRFQIEDYCHTILKILSGTKLTRINKRI